MQFESLANELLLDLFEHLDIGYLFRAFYGLNARFNQLLYIHFRTRQLSFQHLWKDDFDVICQQYLPLLVGQVTSICLSNEETYGLTEIFLSRDFTIDQFIHLKSLSVYHVHSISTLIKIISQCRSLMHLTQLSIIKCEPSWEQYRSIIKLFNHIWSIPKLTHCNLNTFWSLESIANKITTISSSIEHLSIEDFLVDTGLLLTLLKCTPRLQRLCIKILFDKISNIESFTIPSITSLKMSFSGPVVCMTQLLKNLPNLNHLTIMTFRVYLDGHAWEQIILKCLPNIKIFRLIMNFILPEDDFKQEQVKELLATFQTPFWIEKHRWHIRCHWDSTNIFNQTNPYISRYAFDTYGYSNKCCFQSICLGETNCWSDGRIQVARNWNTMNVPFDICNNSCIRLPAIHRLIIHQPIDENFLSSCPTLNQLTSVYVSLNKSYSYSKLQTLLDRTPHLYSLGLYNYEKAHKELFQLQSTSVRRVDFIGGLHYNQEFFDIGDSTSFVTSSLGSKCEVLLIHVENRAVVLNLMNNMFNLRSLNIHCKDDKQGTNQSHATNDELVQWLRTRLPSSCSVMRHYEKKSIIQLWICTLIEERFSSNGSRSIPKVRSTTSQLLMQLNGFLSGELCQSS